MVFLVLIFKGYIKHLEKLKGRIVDFKFRDKSKGWGLQARCTYQSALHLSSVMEV